MADLIDAYDGDGNILVCWQHGYLTDIAESIGADEGPEYPEDRFDLIWTLPTGSDEVTDQETSENCPVLDV